MMNNADSFDGRGRARILIVSPSTDWVQAMGAALQREGHLVQHASDGQAGLRTLYEIKPDVVLVDVHLETLDGWRVLERIRDISDVAVIMVASLVCERDVIQGLRMGTDDFVGRQIRPVELLARIGRLLRRLPSARWSETVYDDGRLQLDPARRSVVADGVPAQLTAIEFRLLNTLTRNSGIVLSQRRLLELVWDDPTGLGEERVKFAVLRLRRRLGWVDPATSPIRNVRSAGYQYDAQVSEVRRQMAA